MKRVDLGRKWKFKAQNTTGAHADLHMDVRKWMDASVPGTVHTDLMAASRIPDPFVRRNELGVQWIEEERWCYRREFEVEADVFAAEAVHLVAEGLDTYARITLNGRLVGQTANMFVEHRFDVRRFLKKGANLLEVLFDSPVARSTQLERKHGSLAVALEPHRVYVRKAQYSFGWDWGPKLTTSGIWRNVYLEAFSQCRIRNIHVRTERLLRRAADLLIDVDLERLTRKSVEVHIRVSGPDYDSEWTVMARGGKVSTRVRVPSPHLWWPNGYGEPTLYRVEVTVSLDGSERDAKQTSFGIRTVRLLQEKDAEGRSFIIEINGVRVFCKGANWIPSDSFLTRISAGTYERLLTLARDAHMNMVRVWGGGIYEDDRFYELCDQLGLMVWQDFMFACGEYPQYPDFLKNVKDETEKAVVRLRNHPCLTVWCGNNECEWIFCTKNPGKSPDDMKGARIFRDLLPSVCRFLDGARPYWRSSPFGSGLPNAESNGNHHQWLVWSAWKDYPEYERDNARFVTEFGFQAPANKRTFVEVCAREDLTPQSPVMEHHNKQVEGTERLVRFQAAHFMLTNNLDRFIEQGQLVQAEALKTAVEHWRRRKFRTAGALFWQLNDCWPVSSWAVIDSALRPKAAYYYAKRFFAPVLVSMRKTDSTVEVWGVNDRLEKFAGALTIQVLTFDGRELLRREQHVTINANTSVLLTALNTAPAVDLDPLSSYVVARLHAGNRTESENRLFFAEPKHLHLPEASVIVEVERRGIGELCLHLKSETIVRGVRLSIEGEDALFSDNCFDLDPGTERMVSVATGMEESTLRQRIRLTSYQLVRQVISEGKMSS